MKSLLFFTLIIFVEAFNKCPFKIINSNNNVNNKTINLFSNKYNLNLANFKHKGGKKVIEYIDLLPDVTPLFKSYHNMNDNNILSILNKYKIEDNSYEQYFTYKKYDELKLLVNDYIKYNNISIYCHFQENYTFFKEKV